ncbi:OmpA family protein, partial [Campylobacter sp.]|uniref:OmpA family protein n=1 Tax=Campylobacter sp. TaxID=205 RepID=UPI002AA942FE
IGDEDGDGVLDNVDRCPGTPKGHVVDEWGCEKVIRLDLGVLFAFDSTEITTAYAEKIKEVSDLLVSNPDYTVMLEGHTDSIGSAKYNQGLSERRAAAVAKVLMENGVAANRISTVGYGKTRPIADNSTKEGRAENRRVDAKFRK